MCVCVCVCACEYVCVRARMCVHVRMCARGTCVALPPPTHASEIRPLTVRVCPGVAKGTRQDTTRDVIVRSGRAVRGRAVVIGAAAAAACGCEPQQEQRTQALEHVGSMGTGAAHDVRREEAVGALFANRMGGDYGGDYLSLRPVSRERLNLICFFLAGRYSCPKKLDLI